MQEGVSKGGFISHVMPEGNFIDLSPNLRASATTTSSIHKTKGQQNQHHEQPEMQIQTGNDSNRQSQQVEKNGKDNQNKGAMAKDLGSKASTSKQESTPKSKNKPSKKKREATKKKQKLQLKTEQQREQKGNEEANYMNSTPNAPPDIGQGKCQLNSIPIIDEYAVNNSEDEMDGDTQSLKDPDDDEETSDQLIRALSPNYEKNLEEEIQQVTDIQGLSPRGFQHNKFHFKKQDLNTVTAGRPNTRLFTSKSSQ
ncbi:hypothetical protein R3W88_034185 [Solanum pinnatisectum]|uniref:Uncharacterized protein n=1 Tax=Solanum pinnatisectum TaxID=50273 RepID=A0AAV9K0H4_9SOLN|nr:hypothetical protein R3W88_034185 [Solanum pinnatisectum]